MTKPRCLDLFCGAGGAAKGLQRAGFYVVGVDIKAQPHYCGDEFYQGDAMTFPLEGYDCYWASPPCQAYSRLRHLPWLKDKVYWRSVPPTRERLYSTGKPWVMENVEDCSDMPDSIILCGQMFQLPVFRHRRFQSHPFLTLQPPHEKHNGVCAHGHASMGKRYASSHVGVKEISRTSMAGHATGMASPGDALGIDWMTRDELAQAIPPAYSEYLGRYMMQAVMPPGYQAGHPQE